MGLYRLGTNKLEAVATTTFAAEKVLERKDIQRMLRTDISPVGDDLMVLAEEFGDWEDSNRRIDLLCLSRNGGLVVVEIKRTEDGGHMELQALRYAAMVSRLTLEQAVETYARTSSSPIETARDEILTFLRVDSEDAALTGDVRIILVSADFSAELTTTVLWLNDRDLDITCVRLKPYRLDGQILVDATQIIPLPEAADYEVRVRAQEHAKRRAEGERQALLRKFWSTLLERTRGRTSMLANRSTTTDHWITVKSLKGFSYSLSMTKGVATIECYIRLNDRVKSDGAYNAIFSRRGDIERAFGSVLEWEPLPERQGSRVCTRIPGGWKATPESEWPALQESMVDALVRLESALTPHIQGLKL
jgi:hypothetical protein